MPFEFYDILILPNEVKVKVTTESTIYFYHPKIKLDKYNLEWGRASNHRNRFTTFPQRISPQFMFFLWHHLRGLVFNISYNNNN